MNLNAQIIGNSNNGTLTDSVQNTSINACKFLCPSNMVVSNIWAKVTGIAGSFKCAIYTDSGGLPNQLLRNTVEVATPTDGWYNFFLTSPLPLTANQNYWFAIWSSVSANVYYTTGGQQRWDSSYPYGIWPSDITLNNDGGLISYCIFATNSVTIIPPNLTNVVGNVTLAWDASPSTNVTGYNVYYGLTSKNYTSLFDAGNNLNYTITNLTRGMTYYFAVTAHTITGVESVYSDEINYMIPVTNQPPVITNLPPTISDIPNQNIFANYTSPKIPFTVYDVDSPINLLSLSLLSSNTTLINSNSFLLVGSSSNRDLYITPITNKTGLSEITMTIRDNSNNIASDKFLVTVSNLVNVTYIGLKLDYGTNLTFRTITNIMAAAFTNPPPNQSYRASLIITNKPF